ncbi:MAG: glycosyltransferase [Oscillospiraceae bacterium]|nr:glycosyltransferase [Oscillospiraceae bacterium]MDD6145607.1 glycosyltransferase [Oscillospiraceae bacterium]
MGVMESSFGSVTVFVLASNETRLLEETISNINRYCPTDDLEKIVIVLKNRECRACEIAERLVSECDNGKIDIYFQKADTLETCIAEIPTLVKSTHFIIMAADMEMSPKEIRTFVEKAKQHPERIICASKWLKDSVVEGYGRFHELASRTLNAIVGLLIGKRARDSVSLYQIYPHGLYQKCNFSNPKTVAYEYTMKPLFMGAEYEEIPTVYRKRTEGLSSYNFWKLFQAAVLIISCAARLRFCMPEYKNSLKKIENNKDVNQ